MYNRQYPLWKTITFLTTCCTRIIEFYRVIYKKSSTIFKYPTIAYDNTNQDTSFVYHRGLQKCNYAILISF